MSDPIPEGYLSLGEGYEIHYRARYGVAPTGHPDTAKRQTETIHEIIVAFASRDLEALAKFPGSPENARLLPESWREQFFADRVFFSPDIDAGKDDPWSPLIGRTPFVEEQKFREWSQNMAFAFRSDDPAVKPIWAYEMALAWIAWRTLDAVREHSDPPVRRLIMGVIEADEDAPDATKVQTIAAANTSLVRALQAGEFVANALDANGDPCAIPASDWAYLHEVAAKDLSLCFSMGGLSEVRYTNVTFRRDDIMDRFKVAPTAPLRKGKVIENTKKKIREYPLEEMMAWLERGL